MPPGVRVRPEIRARVPLGSMAYDKQLASRVRALLRGEAAMSEKPMFGALVVQLDGNMAVAVSDGGLLVRVGPGAVDDALTLPGTAPARMGSRAMRGWVAVERAVLGGERELRAWVQRGASFARTLPPKA
jgi:TfoX/Sxy family transcriptional regulator of competence genes